MRRPRPALASILASTVLVVLTGCGGNSNLSASAVAKCAHARPQTTSPVGTEREVVAKVISGGWLFQSAGKESIAEEQAQAPGFEIYVFPDSKTAQEAFDLINHAPNANEEFGGGGSFWRGNVVISTDQNPPSPLSAFAETLLNKCAGKGTTHSFLREATTNEGASTEATPETSTGEVGAPGESEAPAGQSQIPNEGE